LPGRVNLTGRPSLTARANLAGRLSLTARACLPGRLNLPGCANLSGQLSLTARACLTGRPIVSARCCLIQYGRGNPLLDQGIFARLALRGFGRRFGRLSGLVLNDTEVYRLRVLDLVYPETWAYLPW